GALIDAGRIAGTAKIADAAGGPRATLDLRGESVRWAGSPIVVRSARLAADRPLARLPVTTEARGASGHGAWTISGKGVWNDVEPGYVVNFDGMGALGGRDLHTTETAAFRFGGPERSARVRLAGSDGGRLDLDALMRGEAATVNARVDKMGLNLVN